MSKRISVPAWRIEAERQEIPLKVLAQRTGITSRAIYAYSNGSRTPKPEWVAAVERLLTALDGVREVA